MSANPGSDREDYFWIVDYAMQDEHTAGGGERTRALAAVSGGRGEVPVS